MFTVKLADVIFRIDNKYDYVKNMCRDYIVSDNDADVLISVCGEEIQAEKSSGNESDSYAESLAVYRKIADIMPDFNGFLLHGVFMSCNGKGILLCAKSGVGKSTHAALWQRLMGSECRIINGDKPIIRFKNNKVLAYGTPWAGKERMNINTSEIVTDICFLEQSADNSVFTVSDELLPMLLPQIYIPQNKEKFLHTMDLIGILADNTRQWKILCNMDISAAKTAYEKIFNN